MFLNLLNAAATYADPLAKVGAGLAALYGGWLWLSTLYAKQATAMSGDWTNEGDVLGPPCTHSVTLQTEVTGRHVDGYVQAVNNDGHSPQVRIHGWRIGPYMRVKTTYLLRGDLVSYGFITMRYRTIGTAKQLTFSYSMKPSVLFPAKARLWKCQQ